MEDKTKKTLQWIDGIMYRIDPEGNRTPYNFDEEPKPPPKETEPESEDNGYRAFSNKVYNTLPDLLRLPCERFSDGAEKELFLVGALGVISGMMPHYTGNYFGSSVGTNLYCFVIGNYGTGKGALKWAHMLGNATHQNRLKAAEQDAERYRREKLHYNKQINLFNKGQTDDTPKEPTPPRHLKLFIPANTTKTAVMQLLEENGGRGIIFETEGDTLADMLKQDYGNFSDILRKAYHHEAISFFRRANNEDVTVNDPALSVVLSGTYDQLVKLIPSIENGLYSRFMFYILHGSSEFRDPFEQNTSAHSYHIEQYAQQLAALYELLNSQQTNKQFLLTESQMKKFVTHFKYVKEWTQETVSEELDGSVNRMALMAYRIAMILTMLREYGKDSELKQPAYTCTDADLQNALDIIDVLSYYATDVYEYLNKNGIKRNNGTVKPLSDDELKLIINYRKEGMSHKKIAIEVLGNVNAHQRVKRTLKKYGMQ